MENDLARVWQKIDEHTEKHTKADEKFAMINAFMDEQKRSNIATCKIMTETREEVMSTFNTRFDTQDKLLQQLLADKHRKEGAEAAIQQTQKAEIEKFSMRIQLFKLVPDLIKMLGYIGVGYMLIQQISPHK